MTLATNKQARFNYDIKDKLEAGIKLTGPEVKSVKQGRLDLKGAFASVDKGEVWLKNCFIAPYPPASQAQQNYEPNRHRKLMLHKKEINSLSGWTQQKGVTLLPLRIYKKRGLIKVEIGVGRGRRKADKREAIKKRDFERRRLKLTRARS